MEVHGSSVSTFMEARQNAPASDKRVDSNCNCMARGMVTAVRTKEELAENPNIGPIEWTNFYP